MSGAAPLDGVVLIEFGEWIAAPFAAKLLADLGASVVKYEWGAGDPTRRWGPFPRGAEGDPERSGMFAYLNGGKQGRTVASGTTSAELAEIVDAAAAAADVVVLDGHFLGRLPDGIADRLTARHRHLVLAVVTPFGVDGPKAYRRGYDINISAAGGTAYGVGETDRAPLPVPLSQSEHQSGMALAIAIMMALRARRRDGYGQRVDVASTEAIAALHTAFFLPLFIFGGGLVGCRNGSAGGIPTYPNTVLPCADGLIAVNSPQVAQWIRFCDLMGDPEWTKLPRYRDRRAMAAEYKEEVDALVVDFLEHHTKAELYGEFIARRIPCAPIMTGPDLLANEHLQARGALTTVELPGGGTAVVPTSPYVFSRSNASPGRAPRLGEHDGRALMPRSSDASQGAADGAPPLAGLRVIDLGTAWAGGLAGRFFGDFGADVVKVESWTHMDGSRMGRPIVHGDAASGDAGLWPDLQPGFHVHGRSKRSVAINLKEPAGRDVLLTMIESADVLLHNFSPGVMERLGLSDETLAARNPALVVAGQSVAGRSGPAAPYIGYAGAVAALGGVAAVTGYEGDRVIGMFQGLHSDVISALTTVLGALAALAERDRSGAGQVVEVSQWEATMAMGAEVVLAASLRGDALGPQGFAHPLLVPHGIYRTACPPGEDAPSAYVSVAVGDAAEWWALLGLIDPAGELLGGSARAWDAAERRVNRAAIDHAIERWTERRDRFSAEAELQAAGVAAAAVQTVADMLGDPQLTHRGAFVDLEHPLVGNEPMPGAVWHLLRTPARIVRPAPSLGEHTREVLAERGLTPGGVDALVATGAIELGPSR